MTYSKNAVAFCVTGAHIQLTSISIASLIKNYESSENLDILIIVKDILSEDVNRLRKIPSFYQKEHITISIWEAPKITEQIAVSHLEKSDIVNLWCLFLPHFFSIYEQIIYLNNETIIYDSIDKCFNLLQQPNILAAVKDFYFHVIGDPQIASSHIALETTTNYFNLGFLIFNTALYNKQSTPEELLLLINEHRGPYLEQTILNNLCEQHIQILPFSYNYQKDDQWLNGWVQNQNSLATAEIQAYRNTIFVKQFIRGEKYAMPWEHCSLLDQWEHDFWNYLIDLKRFDYRRHVGTHELE